VAGTKIKKVDLCIHIFLYLVLSVSTDDNLEVAALCFNSVSTFILLCVDIYSCRLLYLSTFMLVTVFGYQFSTYPRWPGLFSELASLTLNARVEFRHLFNAWPSSISIT